MTISKELKGWIWALGICLVILAIGYAADVLWPPYPVPN
jgi:hypothetical protein